jgi:hypothetical protein
VSLLATAVHALQVVDEPSRRPSHDFRVDLIVTRMRPSGAPSRIGHQASSGSIWIKTRLLRFQRWRPHQLGAETPRHPAAWSPVAPLASSGGRPAASCTCNHLGCGHSTPGAGAETVSGACRCPQPRPQEPAYPVESAKQHPLGSRAKWVVLPAGSCYAPNQRSESVRMPQVILVEGG